MSEAFELAKSNNKIRRVETRNPALHPLHCIVRVSQVFMTVRVTARRVALARPAVLYSPGRASTARDQVKFDTFQFQTSERLQTFGNLNSYFYDILTLNMLIPILRHRRLL